MGMMDYQNKCFLNLPMTIGCHDATNARTLCVAKGIHAAFGAGAAPVKIAGQRGYTFANQYLTGATQGWFNQSRIAICMLIRPTFAADDGVGHILFDTDLASRYLMMKRDAGAPNDILVQFGTTSVLVIPLATYQPYWKVNQYNTIIATGVSGDNQIFLNCNSMGTSATAWAAANPVNYSVGSLVAPGLYFAGGMYQVEVYPLRFTQIQATDWHFNALRRLNDQ